MYFTQLLIKTSGQKEFEIATETAYSEEVISVDVPSEWPILNTYFKMI